jgi:hypothetical protein
MSNISRDVFAAFPYLATQIVPALYHLMALPGEYDESALESFARAQTLANRLPACVVLAADRGIYFGVDAVPATSNLPPSGGTIVAGQLAPTVDFAATDGLRTRRAAIDALAETFRRRGGFILGDVTCGGRLATDDEVKRLSGVQTDRVPVGLDRCDRCDDPRGDCLDDRDQFPRRVLTVHCSCDNWNRCARCGKHLYAHRLNANIYDGQAKRVMHVPGFCGLSHRCD